MEIHWLADACVAGAVFLLIHILARFVRRAWSAPPALDLRRSRLFAALDGSRTGMWVWEVGSRQFLCDTRACDNLGVRAGSILSLADLLACIEPSDRSRVEHEMQRAADSEEPFELIARIGARDGSERFVQFDGRPETERGGTPGRISGALRDVTQQRRRNDELRRQAQILNQVHDAIFAATLDGRILTWNAGAERTYGFEAEEAVGRGIQMLWFPEDLPGLESRISEASLVSGASEFVSRVRHKSGAELHADFRLALLKDAEGRAIGLLACSHDVTTQQAEHELLTMQASALESIDDAVFVTDRFETILHTNESVSEMYRLPASELNGMTASALLFGTPAERAIRMEKIRAALVSEGRWSGELVCRSKDPILTSTHITLLDLASGPSWVWVQHDITDQRRTEAALRERERRFRDLADSAPMMVWMTNAEGASEYVNRAWLAQSGMTREEAEGFGWQESIHPEDRLELSRLLDCRKAAGGPFEIELRIDGGNGRLAYALTRGAPRYEGGRLAGFVGSAVDISNIKRAEQERIELEQQALKSQKLHSLGMLAGGIAHDFNNLLVSVLGFSDLALRELEPRHPARELVEQIEVGSRRAAALVEQVLTFAGKARKGEEEVDVNAAIFEMVQLLESTVGRQVVIDLELDKNLPSLIGDPAQVGQVVMNLVLNAADSLGNDGGRIRVRTSKRRLDGSEAASWISGLELESGEYVQLEVHDDGCGMNEETMSLIFDPFFTTKAEGRGLGLSAVMGVVRSHLGAIRVESAEGEGSSFSVLLPLPRPLQGLAGQRLPRLAGQGAVLVIDDDPTVVQATRQMLQSGGLKVFCAQDEAEAVRVFEGSSREIQLVILDVVMPGTNPSRIGVRLRQERDDVRILLTSGYSEFGHRPKVDGETFVGFIPKPYDRSRLLDAVAAACLLPLRESTEDAASA